MSFIDYHNTYKIPDDNEKDNWKRIVDKWHENQTKFCKQEYDTVNPDKFICINTRHSVDEGHVEVSFQKYTWILPTQNWCTCGFKLKYNFVVIHLESKTPFLVGSECIKRLGIKKIRNCINCDISIKGRSKSVDTCKKCKRCKWCEQFDCKCMHGNTIRFGKHIGKTFKYVFDNDRPYCVYVNKQVNSNSLPAFKEFAGYIKQMFQK